MTECILTACAALNNNLARTPNIHWTVIPAQALCALAASVSSVVACSRGMCTINLSRLWFRKECLYAHRPL